MRIELATHTKPMLSGFQQMEPSYTIGIMIDERLNFLIQSKRKDQQERAYLNKKGRFYRPFRKNKEELIFPFLI